MQPVSGSHRCYPQNACCLPSAHPPDITMAVDSFPKENTKNRIDNRVECGGGPAGNAAYLLGKWGMDVHFAGVVGNDEYGKRIKEEFESVNVNTK